MRPGAGFHRFLDVNLSVPSRKLVTKLKRWDVPVPVMLDLHVLAIRSSIHVTVKLLSKPGRETLLKWVVSEKIVSVRLQGPGAG